jgi:cytochrome c556
MKYSNQHRGPGICGRLVLLATLAFGAASHADDQDTVDYRQHIMKTLGEQVAILGMMAQQKAPSDDFATHVQALALTAATAKAAFEPEIRGGNAKPEVWSQWADFEKRIDALAAATADLAKTAKSGGAAAAAPKLQSALTCKGCHDTYRVPKK